MKIFLTNNSDIRIKANDWEEAEKIASNSLIKLEVIGELIDEIELNYN